MSDLRRFFVEEASFPLTISGEEFNHAVNVLRIRQGEKVIVCDNTGDEYFCEVEKINKKDFLLKFLEKRQSDTEAKEDVMLICGYLKGDKTELVVQKAVELGAKKIVVFSSQFCASFMSENKLNRLNKVSLEASKQCGRAIAPKVEYADTFRKALEFGKDYKNKLFACEFASKSTVDLNSLKGSTSIVIGSEGGFSQEESELAKEYDYQTVSLGKRILRAETASIALLAIVMQAIGELQ